MTLGWTTCSEEATYLVVAVLEENLKRIISKELTIKQSQKKRRKKIRKILRMKDKIGLIKTMKTRKMLGWVKTLLKVKRIKLILRKRRVNITLQRQMILEGGKSLLILHLRSKAPINQTKTLQSCHLIKVWLKLAGNLKKLKRKR